MLNSSLSEINNMQIDNAIDLDVVMPKYNLIEYSTKHSKTYESLWQYYRNEPVSTDSGAIDNFPDKNASFKSKQKITGQTGNDGTKHVEEMLLIKYLSNFWRTLEMPLIFLTKPANCFIVAETANNQKPTFAITDTKLYVPVVALSTQFNVKLLQQLKSSFKRIMNGNKDQSKLLDFQVDPNFQEVSRLFVLSFENNVI